MTHSHRTLRDHLIDLAERGHEPVFTPVDFPPLVEFDRLFATLDWYSFDVNRYLDDDAFHDYYQLRTEVVRHRGDEPEAWEVSWTATLPGVDPYEGFTLATSGILWGGPTEVPPPDDPLTEACLLVVTNDFVHLSASREQDPPLVRGAIDGPGDGFDYVVLDRGDAAG